MSFQIFKKVLPRYLQQNPKYPEFYFISPKYQFITTTNTTKTKQTKTGMINLFPNYQKHILLKNSTDCSTLLSIL